MTKNNTDYPFHPTPRGWAFRDGSIYNKDMGKYVVVHDDDLDGNTAAIQFLWKYGNEVTFISKRVRQLDTIIGPDCKFDTRGVDTIFFLDLDTSNHSEFINKLAQTTNVVVIDHHDTHNTKLYSERVVNKVFPTASSAAKIVYAYLKQDLTPQQKKLVFHADDYDSFTLKSEDSFNLNIVFNKIGYTDKAEKFRHRFNDGFHGFDDKDLAVIKLFYKDTLRAYNNASKFTGEVEGKYGNTTGNFKTLTIINNNKRTGICPSTMSRILHKKNAKSDSESDAIDILIFVSSNMGVSLRKAVNNDFDLSFFAAEVFKGGGHKDAAGGIIDDEVAEKLRNMQ